MPGVLQPEGCAASPSSRRAWVEIAVVVNPLATSAVALLAEGVGRNHKSLARATEGVKVALLAEGVGRNTDKMRSKANLDLSPSSRRAWVEICIEMGGNDNA